MHIFWSCKRDSQGKTNTVSHLVFISLVGKFFQEFLSLQAAFCRSYHYFCVQIEQIWELNNKSPPLNKFLSKCKPEKPLNNKNCICWFILPSKQLWDYCRWMNIGVCNSADYQTCLQTQNNHNVFVTPPQADSSSFSQSAASTRADDDNSDDTKLWGHKTMPTTKKKPSKSFLQFFFAIPPLRTWLFQGVPQRNANFSCNKHFSVTCIHLTLCSCAPLVFCLVKWAFSHSLLKRLQELQLCNWPAAEAGNFL